MLDGRDHVREPASSFIVEDLAQIPRLLEPVLANRTPRFELALWQLVASAFPFVAEAFPHIIFEIIVEVFVEVISVIGLSLSPPVKPFLHA